MAWPRLIAMLLVLLSLPLTARAEEAEDRRVQLLYTGFTGGLSSASITYSELAPLFRPDPKRPFSVGGASADNVFRHGDFLIYTHQGPLSLADFRACFSSPVELHPAGQVDLIASEYAYLLTPGPADAPWLLDWLWEALETDGSFPDARRMRAARFTITNRQGLSLSLVSLTGEAPPLSLLESPARWEMLSARALSASKQSGRSSLMAVGRPLGEGLRRAWLLKRLVEEAGSSALVADVGNLLDPGFSDLSLQQREFTLLQLSQLGYQAVVPGETELLLEGPDWERFAKLVPLVAANLTPADAKRDALPGVIIKQVNGLTIALVGVVDDRALTLAGAAGPKAPWRVSDPIAATTEAVASLRAQAPDAVLLLTNVRDERLHQLRHIRGVTAVVGDFTGLPGLNFDESVRLSWASWKREPVAFMIAHSSPNRVGRLEATFQVQGGLRPALRELRNESRLVTDAMPFDEAWRHQLNLTLDRYQTDRRELLLPDLREAIARAPEQLAQFNNSATPWLDARTWTRLVATMMRRATRAEVAVLRELPVRDRGVGPLSRLALEGALEVGDRLVQTTLTGKALRALAARDGEAKLLAFAGFDPAANTVSGHKLIDAELYRVTTTDMVARHSLYEGVFSNRPLAERWLRHPDGWARPYAEGERTRLRDLALGAFAGLKRAHGNTFGETYMAEYTELLAGSGRAAPRWTIQLEDAHLLLNQNSVHNNAAFSQVRNNRVTAPGSFALGGRGRLSTVYDSHDVAWENRARSIYKRQTIEKNGASVTQETDDEVVLTSEFRLKALQLPLAGQAMPLIPFVNSNYTTELTPQEGKPRRAELNAVSGLVLYPAWGFKELRAGATVRNDLANPGLLEPGLLAQAIYEQVLPGPVPATLRGGLDITQYWPTPTDTPDRLGLLANFNGAVVLPLWDNFNFTVSADYFMFRGKVPATYTLGGALDFKVGIGYTLGFKPFYGVWY